MSLPNDGQQGSGPGSNPVFNPALLNANAALANLNSSAAGDPALLTNLPPAVQQQISNFNPAQLARLTEFHRQIPQQQQSASTSSPAPAAAIAAAVRPSASAPFAANVPQHVRQVMASTDLTAEQRNDFLSRWLRTDEGRLAAQQHRQATVVQAALATNATGTGPSVAPSNPTSGQSNSRPAPSVTSQQSGIMYGQNSDGGVASASGNGIQGQGYGAPRPSSSQSNAANMAVRPPGSLAIPFNPPQQQLNRPAMFSMAPSVPPGWDAPARRHTSPEPAAPRAAPAPRRREEGMRGTMRSELARLMYASGDVENPDLDTIDYMEDLVVDWLADLCAPPPPVRSNPSAPLVAPRLDYNIIRHRLSRPSMRKYLDRFEYMEYKAIDMRSARRVARGNFEPVDQKDLDRQLEKGFLDGEDSGQLGPEGGQTRKKRKYTRHVDRPQTEEGAGMPKERKKPGPKKGWKAGLGDERARKIKSARQSTGPSVSSGRGSSVKPEE